MAKKKPQLLTTEQRLDLLKSFGHGVVEIMKQPVPAYLLSSLAILGLGKAKVLSCGVVGTIQGVNTYLAISQQIDESDGGIFGIGQVGETMAKGGTSVLIGALWATECSGGKQRYSPGNGSAPTDLFGFTQQETGWGFTKTHDKCEGLTGMDYLRCRRGLR